MKYLFSFKKEVLGVLLLCAMAVSSCTNENEVFESTKAKPGIYTIEMTIDAQKLNAQTRGVQNNNDFDSKYDPPYIYLHCGEEALKIPVYAYCQNCETGFRYQVEVKEDGSAVLTPIDENGEYMATSLTIPQGSQCYFSSWESDEWKLPDSQIIQKDTQDGTNYTFYQRKNDINQEIYRSASNYTIDDLVTNGDLVIKRACAGFNVVGLFYDGEEADALGPDGGWIRLDSTEFNSIMSDIYPNDVYSNWYIKILIGGSAFTDKYDFVQNESIGSRTGGYYSSGDASLFEEGIPDANKYLKFSQSTYATGSVFYEALGYYTKVRNHLFTPVTGGDGEVNVYVMIKHWTGTDEPGEDWLLDDSGALYTKVDISGSSVPSNNSFYTMGLLMDIRQFKIAWDDAGGDNYTESNVSTRGLNPPREFVLKNAKVICESY